MEQTTDVKMADGKPLSVLNQLLKRRSELLRQSVRDATIACMINVLTSLRAESRTAENRKKFEIKVEDTGWYGGFSKTEGKPVVREGISPYSKKIKVDGKIVWLTHGIKKQCDKHVYKVTPENLSYPIYYIVASSPKVALNHETQRALHRVKQLGGLARNALGVGMAKLAANSSMSGSGECRNKASKLSDVKVRDMGDSVSVRVTDALEYATGALKSGDSGVDIAMMKAANKVAGILKHFGGKSLDEEFGTPFPEVKKRK